MLVQLSSRGIFLLPRPRMTRMRFQGWSCSFANNNIALLKPSLLAHWLQLNGNHFALACETPSGKVCTHAHPGKWIEWKVCWRPWKSSVFFAPGQDVPGESEKLGKPASWWWIVRSASDYFAIVLKQSCFVSWEKVCGEKYGKNNVGAVENFWITDIKITL